MYLRCINKCADGSGEADYRQGIVEGVIYRVADDKIQDVKKNGYSYTTYAVGKRWLWNVRRFQELSKVEVIIELGKHAVILELP